MGSLQAVQIFLRQRFTHWRMCLNLSFPILPVIHFLLCLPEAAKAGAEITYESAPQPVFADRFIYSSIANQVINAKKNGEKTLWPEPDTFYSEQRLDGDVSRESRLIIDDARNHSRIHLILNPAQIKKVLNSSPGKSWAVAVVDNLLQSLLKLKESPSTDPEDSETYQPMVTAAAGSGDDDEGENVGGSSIRLYYSAPSFTYQPEPVEWVSGEIAEHKIDLLRDILQRLDIALADGHRDLILMLRDRLMIVLADMRDMCPFITSVILSPGNHSLAQPDNISPYLMQMQRIYHQASSILSSLNHDTGYARQTPTSKTNPAASQKNTDNAVSDYAAVGYSVTPSNSGEADNNPGDDSRNKKPGNTEEDPQSLQVCEQCNTPLTEQNTVAARQKSTLQQQPLLCDDCWDYEESCVTGLGEEVKSKNADAPLLTEVTMEDDSEDEDFSGSSQSYQQLIDDFLEIPVEDHLPLPEACRLNLSQTMKEGLEKEGLEKVRALLNRTVFNWIYKKDPDDARKEFLEVEIYASAHGIELSVFVKNWIGLWWYKQIFNSRNEYKARLLALLYNYEEESNDDLVSLQKLLTEGALIGFEDFADFKLSDSITKRCNVFTAVSFTVVDQFRYCCFDKQIVDASFSIHRGIKGIAFRNLLSNLIYFLVDEYSANGAKYKRIIVDKFRKSNSFHELELSIPGKEETFVPISHKTYNYLLGFTKLGFFRGYNSKILPIIYFDIVKTLLHQPVLTVLEKQEIGKCYRLLADYYPISRKGAYTWYKKLLMYSAAAREAQALVEYWTPINVLFAHHWEENYREVDELSKQKEDEKTKPASCETSTHNIEEAIAAFDDERARVMIGIERVWQEHAWTLMHEFDDSFDMGFLAESKRQAAWKTARVVKNKLLLPALALTLGMDEMSARTSSREVWKRARDLLARAEFQEQEVNDEFRLRLRCLFNSMGHVYTLLAMSAPVSFKSQFEEKAKVWFGLKRIDTKWDRQRLPKPVKTTAADAKFRLNPDAKPFIPHFSLGQAMPLEPTHLPRLQKTSDWINKAFGQFRNQQFQDSEREFRSILQTAGLGKSKKNTAIIGLARSLQKQTLEKTKEACTLLEELKRNSATDFYGASRIPALDHTLSLCKKKLGQFNEAERLLLAISKKYTKAGEGELCKPCGQHDIDLALARLWLVMGKNKRAEALLLAMSDKAPEADEASLCVPCGQHDIDLDLARAWQATSKYKRAEALLLAMSNKAPKTDEADLCVPCGQHDIDLTLARLWESMGEHKRAEALLLAMSNKDPEALLVMSDNDPKIYEAKLCRPCGQRGVDLTLARVWECMGEYKRAETLLLAMSDKDPEAGEVELCKPCGQHEIDLTLAGLWQVMGKIRRAEALLLAMSDKDPEAGEVELCKPCGQYRVDLALVRLWEVMGEYERAEALLLTMSDKDPKAGEVELCKPCGRHNVDLTLVRVWEYIGKYKKAETLLLAMSDKAPEADEATLCKPCGQHGIDLTLARLWGGIGKYERAEALLLAMSDKAPEADEAKLCKSCGQHDIDLALVRIWQDMDKTNQPEKLLTSCLQSSYSGECELAQLYMYSSSKEFIERVAELKDSSNKCLTISIYYFNKACQQISRGELSQSNDYLRLALEHVDKALKDYRPTAAAYSQKAHCLRMMNKSKWRPWFIKAYSLDPNRVLQHKTENWRKTERNALEVIKVKKGRSTH